ncbi:hypothetical protein [Mucilaginibacter sp. FT3.2]|uniref:hypothetical protein n=1 Tax=Mucilaginibacter sp. FT3.2 TaxID=2723090 RepID=UPI00161EAFBE|nr:hypothetical protein [Mucilaginibacter sp. FT3.2]MBB6234510.1 hypothetical protein [Mucilaginibacter sp. FT3.2]
MTYQESREQILNSGVKHGDVYLVSSDLPSVSGRVHTPYMLLYIAITTIADFQSTVNYELIEVDNEKYLKDKELLDNNDLEVMLTFQYEVPENRLRIPLVGYLNYLKRH